MTLLVETPHSYAPEREYVIDLVFNQLLGVEYQLTRVNRADTRLSMASDPDGRDLTIPDVLFRTPPEEWLTEASMPPQPLMRWPANEESPSGWPDGMPLVYARPIPGGAPHMPTASGLTWSLDVFGSIFFMVTRLEEVVVTERDRFGAFPPSRSIAGQEGFLQRPIVNAYVDVLWDLMRGLWPGLRRKVHPFSIRLTHDVDRPFATVGRPLREVGRRVLGDLGLRRNPGRAVGSVMSHLRGRLGNYRTDSFATYDFLMETSERHGLRSEFYFKAGATSSEYDVRYDLLAPPIAATIARIHRRGHSLGLHASYDTFRREDLFQSELARFLQVCDRLGVMQPVWGGRQHYLRWENPITWQIWDKAGMAFDSTLGYWETTAFRSGITMEHPVFDLVGRRQLSVRELPLNIMDVTLAVMKLSPEDALTHISALAGETRRHGGDLVLLWHNNSLPTDEDRRWYASMVEVVANG